MGGRKTTGAPTCSIPWMDRTPVLNHFCKSAGLYPFDHGDPQPLVPYNHFLFVYFNSQICSFTSTEQKLHYYSYFWQFNSCISIWNTSNWFGIETQLWSFVTFAVKKSDNFYFQSLPCIWVITFTLELLEELFHFNAFKSLLGFIKIHFFLNLSWKRKEKFNNEEGLKIWLFI